MTIIIVFYSRGNAEILFDNRTMMIIIRTCNKFIFMRSNIIESVYAYL